MTKTGSTPNRKTAGSPSGGGAGGNEACGSEHPAGSNRQRVIERISGFDEKLVAINESLSPVTESFRRLRTKLLHPDSGAIPRGILITSVAENEGKGFVAANLAVILAQGLEEHALLVDCDLRRPSLAGQFGLSNEKGVVDHLQDGIDLSLLIRPTGIPKLSIIPAGVPPANPSELLASEKMTVMMQELTSRYSDRLVIFDSPPMHAASESMVLARHVDAAVLVVRWGSAGREEVKKLAGMLGRDKIAGLVFNGVQINEFENKFYPYRYHEYGSRYYR